MNKRLGNILRRRLIQYDKDERSNVVIVYIFTVVGSSLAYAGSEPLYLWATLILVIMYRQAFIGSAKKDLYRIFRSNLEYIPKNAKKQTQRLFSLRNTNYLLIVLYFASLLVVDGLMVIPLVIALIIMNYSVVRHSKKVRHEIIQKYIDNG